MKFLVVGTSKGTGALCVKSALAKGHEVSAFARTRIRIRIHTRTRIRIHTRTRIRTRGRVPVC